MNFHVLHNAFKAGFMIEAGPFSKPESNCLRIPVIVAAAGQSRRYGRPKLLEPMPGVQKTLIRHVVEQLAAGGLTKVVVVLGPQSEEPYGFIGSESSAGGGFALHLDPGPAEMRDSIASGIRHLERMISEGLQPEPTHVLFTPADIPGMSSAYVLELTRRCQVRSESLIRGVTPLGRGMHPVALAWSQRHTIDGIPSNKGLNELWKGFGLSSHEWLWNERPAGNGGLGESSQ